MNEEKFTRTSRYDADELFDKGKKENRKKIIIIGLILLLLLGLIGFLVFGKKNKTESKKTKEKTTVKKEEPKEKVDIINLESKSRPFAVVVNNTPVAVKVQEGLTKAYIVYELPTEGSTSRLMALYKDVDDVTIGTIRSARHNFMDYAHEHDAIFVAYGWSHYAKDELQKGGTDYINGIFQSQPFWRNNPENLAKEHTAYTSIAKLKDFAINNRKYKMESDNTILFKYNVKDVDLSSKEGVVDANKVTVPYGNITTVFNYDSENKVYIKSTNGNENHEHNTGEKITTKNIIIEKITFTSASDNYYWNLNTTGSGTGYYITNGKSVPINWSKEGRNSKTKYTYKNGEEIELSDGITYIEVHTTSKKEIIE